MEYLAVIIWPVVVIFAIIVFRNPIIGLINRGFKLNAGGVNLEAPAVPQQDNLNVLDKGNEQPATIVPNLFDEATLTYFRRLVSEESALESHREEDKLKALLDYSTLLLIKHEFERTYVFIYGSQISLLKYLNTSVDYHNTVDSVKVFYDAAVEQFPELKGYGYENYIHFLSAHGLIEIKDKGIKITILGRDFLKFMVHLGLTESKWK